jgi:hypothetical protein
MGARTPTKALEVSGSTSSTDTAKTPTTTLAEGRASEHGHPEGDEIYRHWEERYA